MTDELPEEFKTSKLKWRIEKDPWNNKPQYITGVNELRFSIKSDGEHPDDHYGDVWVKGHPHQKEHFFKNASLSSGIESAERFFDRVVACLEQAYKVE